MKKYKQAAASIAILTVMFSAGLFSSVDANKNSNSVLKQNRSSQQEEVLTTFENQDYEAWRKILVKNNKNNINLSQDDFNAFIVARQEARAGNYGQAIAISQKLQNKQKNTNSTLL
jgi:uncharacterized membrane protein